MKKFIVCPNISSINEFLTSNLAYFYFFPSIQFVVTINILFTSYDTNFYIFNLQSSVLIPAFMDTSLCFSALRDMSVTFKIKD